MVMTSHLKSVEESYFVHLYHALGYAIKFFYATVVVLIHAIFPQIHQNTASSIAKKIVDGVNSRKNIS